MCSEIVDSSLPAYPTDSDPMPPRGRAQIHRHFRPTHRRPMHTQRPRPHRICNGRALFGRTVSYATSRFLSKRIDRSERDRGRPASGRRGDSHMQVRPLADSDLLAPRLGDIIIRGDWAPVVRYIARRPEQVSGRIPIP